MINALIYLPDHISATSIIAQECRTHIEIRGYQLLGFVHSWPEALALLRARAATVVVFGRPEHFEPTFEPRIEFVGEDTQDLTRHDTRPRHRNEHAGDSRSRRPRVTN